MDTSTSAVALEAFQEVFMAVASFLSCPLFSYEETSLTVSD